MTANLLRFIAAIALLSPLPSFAQQTDPTPAADSASAATQPVTASDPSIAIDRLDLLLDPLTRSELLLEAQAWRDLLQDKVWQVTLEEIAARSQRERIQQLDQSEQAQHIEAIQDEANRSLVLEDLAKRQEEKAALLERFRLVLDEYERKGGDASEFRQYAAAVSGITVEVTDANAAWTAIKGWLASSEGGLKWARRILQFAGIVLLFWILALSLAALVRRGTERRPGISGLMKDFLNKFIKRAVLVIGVVVALSSLGVHVGAILAIAGGSAFILGFALQDTLGNFAAGMMLLFYRPFDVGDAVEVGGVTGKVDSVSLVNTTIRTFDNKIVLVPNSKVWGQVITNITGSDTRRVDMVFAISYGDDVDRAKEILSALVKSHPLALDQPEPTIELNELANSSLNLICRPWVRTADYWRLYWDLTRSAKNAFDEAGITIPFPQTDVHLFREDAPRKS